MFDSYRSKINGVSGGGVQEYIKVDQGKEFDFVDQSYDIQCKGYKVSGFFRYFFARYFGLYEEGLEDRVVFIEDRVGVGLGLDRRFRCEFY